ncbi:divalent-cation tolerance protein CutA [Thermosulfidibacter takaii]|nr:divalent-cation tolerance protein CutA [Thermosulfidibacter takaii]
MDYLMVLTTTDDYEVAKNIAKTLIEEKFAACVQIIPNIESVYWWEGKVEESKEFLIFIKTTKKLYPGLERRIRALHNYSVPEIIAFRIKEGFKKYLQWLEESVS